jgi:hypothetical protein
VNIVALFSRIWFHFFPKPALEIPKDETLLFIEKQTDRFLYLFTLPDEERNLWNKNIDDRMYSLDSFQKLMLDETNELEPEWKRRILMVSTPRGNVIMFYDIYKQAFAYVSDQHMNYPILNACAMKYVEIYNCIDFFIDGNVLPEGFVSPFVLLQEEAEKREKEKQVEKKKEMGIHLGNAPFAKLKTYKVSDEKQEPVKIQPTNIFRYLGKISNLSLLQKIKKPVKVNPLITCPIESFDYLSYKNRMNIQMNEASGVKASANDDSDSVRELDIDYDSTSTMED